MTLDTALQAFPSLLPADIELGTILTNDQIYRNRSMQSRNKHDNFFPEGLALTFAEDPKIFITQTGCKPHLKILGADLYGLCVILEQSSLIQIHQKLASSSMQFSFKRTTVKTYSVETG